MALTGTLKDFGIAEILQLIGQQAKSGVLHLESRGEQIHITMADGNVVRAESAGRKAREKLGSRLVRAELISPTQLEYALDIQKRTLRRLGDVLVELGYVPAADLRQVTALQTAETVYRLFHWKSGTYAFEPGAVEWDPETVTPQRAESVLMEGFRQVDEWPLVRKTIPALTLTFERLRPLEPDRRPAGTTDEIDAALGGLDGTGGGSGRPEPAPGRNERRVYDLAVPGRPASTIVDLSRLGEFETCKALHRLVVQGYLAPAASVRERGGLVGASARDWRNRLRSGAVRVGTTLVIAAALAGLAAWVDERGLAWGERRSAQEPRDNSVQRHLARYQRARLAGALEVYRVEQGAYPERLGALVEAGLVDGRDLRHPFEQEYHYRRRPEGGYVLLPPVE